MTMTVYRALQPILLAIFGVLARFLRRTPFLKTKTKKLWTTWDMRYVDGVPAFLKIDRDLFGGEKPIWIHAASGEFEYAKPVIRAIRKISSVPVLVTYFSPTYAENVATFSGVTVAVPLPLDSRDELESFLRYIEPKALLIARTDAWPNTVSAALDNGIPILLFSATFHAQSKRMRLLAQGLTTATLKQISLIQCVDEDDQKTLATLGLSHTVVAGDSRYDQVLERLNTPPIDSVKRILGSIKSVVQVRAFVAGSVWSEDLEPVVLASFANQSATPHTLILVPHEVSETFLKEIEAVCTSTGFKEHKIARLSSLDNFDSRASGRIDVLVVDSVGLLAELYLLGDLAFVGGSFRKTVHSVMEPLAAGCLTIVGPLHTNNREAIEFRNVPSSESAPKYVTSVNDATEFTAALSRNWDALKGTEFRPLIRQEVASRGGATAHVIQWLSEHDLI